MTACSSPPPFSAKIAAALGLVITLAVMAGCSKPEDPARVELRRHLVEPATMSAEDFARFRAEVSRELADKHLRIKDAKALKELTDEQQKTVLGVLTDPVGVFDEGIQREGDVILRIVNAPGESEDQEVEATRRLLIDTRTFQPIRFTFTYAAHGFEDYTYDLIVAP